ncbi:CMGC/MAPK protein kinase [Thecamonas trahens ATCC 50062]|uniref:Mitogen-activated protein kinase n=1 Tax=Thecamonas trahens ATCC 50062 TaxID=461836 RepID=A0A0L0DQW2_THETB|nr:CMGC/MAPK protein kinase [Thecamonas trahens ATCC 50062]KNC54411.1 CMGC/MAPK protein kinase [Thecamonas trahens ATCC 50062]|eukprot:XP_013753708.1 CMGC/MAPK protein kinase [Thecamonas trahens ATCC 50062]
METIEAAEEGMAGGSMAGRSAAASTGVKYKIGQTPFVVNSNYKVVRALGSGAFGVVCEAVDLRSGSSVAIKRIGQVFRHLTDAKRCLREVRLLKHLRHENVITLFEVMPPLGSLADFRDLYIVTELMETDLHQVIQSDQQLTNEYVQYFLYQILRGVKYIHSAHVIHRDLKPSNLLVNSNCDLKICDFGLARVADPDENHAGFMTEYVATRWYRAPEVMLSWSRYTKAMDVWSIGCIFAELLLRRPLLPGRDFLHQLQLIVSVLGTPAPDDLAGIKSDRARRYMQGLPHQDRADFARLFPSATPAALDLLSGLLEFNPDKRLTVEEALAHPYMADIHDPSDEPVADEPFNFAWEQSALTHASVRHMLTLEAVSYHPDAAELIAQLGGFDDDSSDPTMRTVPTPMTSGGDLPPAAASSLETPGTAPMTIADMDDSM